MGRSRGFKSAQRMQKTIAFATWLYTYHKSELLSMLHYGTPSDRLVILARSRSPGGLMLPRSLDSRAGQRRFYKAIQWVDRFKKSTPVYCLMALDDCYEIATRRRTKQAQENAAQVAEAILGFSAAQFTTTTIMSTRIMREWIFTRYGKELTHTQMRRQLEWWHSENSPITVSQWGVSRDYGTSTAFRVKLGAYASAHHQMSTEEKLLLQQRSDEWVDQVAPANTNAFLAIRMIQEYEGGFRGHWLRKQRRPRAVSVRVSR